MSYNSSFEAAPPSDGKLNLYVVASIWFIVVAVLSWLWIRESPDPREPPQLKPKFPVIGHLLGILQHEAEYFQKLRFKASRPLFIYPH
jgi:hypothetical protein